MSRAESGSPTLHGFLVIDKPAGWTSHDVVARVRRLTGERRIGHAGTLDPAATGVLPLAVGSATRVVEYLSDASKTYRAEMTFGVETDTFDGDGRVVATGDSAGLTRPDVEGRLSAFRGTIEQVPPMHSAIKVDGRRLYELARRGEEVDRPPRQVTISCLELVAWEPPVATLVVDCSKGTYVRALAHDLGAAVGTGAYLSDLVRLRTGPFGLDDAVTLEQLAAIELPGSWSAVAHHPDAVLADWPALLLDRDTGAAWQHGGLVTSAGQASGRCRVYDDVGNWLGVGTADAGGARWRPLKVVEGAA